MSVLRPQDQLPGLNAATILLVGKEDALLQPLADSMLKEDCASTLRVHLAHSLPLPSDVNRPRIDLIVFVVNLHSKYSLQNVEESLRHVDATFFLGKVGFLVTGGKCALAGQGQCAVHLPAGAGLMGRTGLGIRPAVGPSKSTSEQVTHRLALPSGFRVKPKPLSRRRVSGSMASAFPPPRLPAPSALAHRRL
uniref:Centromere protein M n=1 Tax=Myotis myotis TaxID=51298 RepID=A0A7J7Z112_MYOMY|nr:centromere protein M [Myotis myotis]